MVEEKVVLFELVGLPNPDLIKDKSCYILGIETERPIIQVGSLVFQGNYEDILGTGLVFEKLSDGSVKLCGKTMKKVKMLRVPIRHKKNSSEESKSVDQ